MIQLDDQQTSWVLAEAQEARETNRYWRVAVAVAAHESGCGTSHLAEFHNNLHGLTATKDQPKDDNETNGEAYRHFDNPRESWLAFARWLQVSTWGAVARREAAKTSWVTERARDWAIVRAMFGVYCSQDSWIKGVLDWLDVVWRLLPPARSGPIIPPKPREDGIP